MMWLTKSKEQEAAPEVEEPQTYDYKVTVVFKDGTTKSFLADYSYDIQGHGRMIVWQDAMINYKHYEYYSIPSDDIKEVLEEANE